MCLSKLGDLPSERKHARWTAPLCGVLFALLFASVNLLAGAGTDLDRLQRLAHERYGPAAASLVEAWRDMLDAAASADDLARLRTVNTFFNRSIRFQDDIVTWAEHDFWATPAETMGMGAGDCEDFTIAKYMSLRHLGVPDEKLRLIYVRARLGGPHSTRSQAHMVLGYYATPTSEPLILDNLIGDVLPAARRSDLYPVYSFNSAGLWVGNASTPAADPTARLSRWRSVVARMHEEGFR